MRRFEGENQVHTPLRQQQTHQAAGKRQQQVFGQDLPDNSLTAGAKSGPQGKFPLRLNKRPEMLAHAISMRKPTTTRRVSRAGRMGSTISR